MKVKDLMTRDLVTCKADQSAQDAARLMEEHDCGSLPVLDGEEAAGVITDRDLCLTAMRRDARLQDLKVRDAMSADPLCCAPDDGIDVAQEPGPGSAVAEAVKSDLHGAAGPPRSGFEIAAVLLPPQVVRLRGHESQGRCEGVRLAPGVPEVLRLGRPLDGDPQHIDSPVAEEADGRRTAAFLLPVDDGVQQADDDLTLHQVRCGAEADPRGRGRKGNVLEEVR